MSHPPALLFKDLPFPVFFVALWLLVTTLLNWWSGYLALRKRYPPVDEPLEQLFSSVSGALGGVSYRNALRVGCGATGLHLAPFLLFRPISARGVPCIPWKDIQCTRVPSSSQSWFWFWGSRYEFEVHTLRLNFGLDGKAGAALARRLGTAS